MERGEHSPLYQSTVLMKMNEKEKRVKEYEGTFRDLVESSQRVKEDKFNNAFEEEVKSLEDWMDLKLNDYKKKMIFVDILQNWSRSRNIANLATKWKEVAWDLELKRRFWPTSKDFAWKVLEAEVRKNYYKIGK